MEVTHFVSLHALYYIIVYVFRLFFNTTLKVKGGLSET